MKRRLGATRLLPTMPRIMVSMFLSYLLITFTVSRFFGSHKWGSIKKKRAVRPITRVAIRHKERGQSSSSTSLGAWPNPYQIDESDAHVSSGHLLSILSDTSFCGQASRTFFRINSKCLLSSHENDFSGYLGIA